MASIFRQQYTARDANGKKVKCKSQYWYIDYKTADGTRKRVKGFKDKTATVQLVAKLEREAEQAQVGIIDKYKEQRKKPLVEHLNDFRASLENKGTTEKHACLVYNRAKAVIECCKFAYIADIAASRVQRYLAERRRDGLSIRSSNFYLQAIKQFCRWLVADNRAAENPLTYLQGQNPKTDIRHSRRALSVDELNKLIKSTAQGQKHSGMTAKERTMLYRLALTTGLRAGELASLTWQSFNLMDSTPSVTVLAAYSKHRRDDVQLLPLEVAEQFRKWQQEVNTQENNKVFGKFDKSYAAKMLRKDLKAAGIAYKDDAGQVVDFHALRHTYITNIVKGGASVKVAQSLARHSTVNLTMDTYTHLNLHDGKAALSGLPKLPDEDSPDVALTKNLQKNLTLITKRWLQMSLRKKLNL
jgi:integrase